MAVTKWVVTTCAQTLRRIGKLGEELSELGAVTNRITIQGLDEVDPSSGKTNRARLQEEIADVYAQLDLAVTQFRLDSGAIGVRVADKKARMAEWEAMFEPGNT